MSSLVFGMLDKVKNGFINLVSRFPTTLLYVFTIFSISVYLTEGRDLSDQTSYTLVMVLLLFVLLSISSLITSLLFEKKYISRINGYLGQFINFILVGGLWSMFVLPDVFAFNIISGAFTSNMYRLIILFVVLTLAAFVIPFIKDKDGKDFWSFGVGTVFAGCIGVIYGVVVYLGIALALFAIESFWKFTFSDNQYATVAMFAFLLIAPINFLRNLPKDIVKIKFLELPNFAFTLIKFVLLPLVIVYTLIIYPYMASFPFRSEWPSNEATTIIVGLLALVYVGILMFNGLDREGIHKKFINFYTRVFSAITLPAIIFWAYSLFLRIDAYGLTINRFFLMSIIFWSFGVGLYYVFLRGNDIKKVILSFIFLLVLVFYVPFSGFFWSNKSQFMRLMDLAESKGMIKDNKLVKLDGKLSYDENVTFNELLYYLNVNRGLKGVQDNLGDDILKDIKIDKSGYSSVLKYQYSSNIKFATSIESYVGDSKYQYITIEIADHSQFNIPEGYSKFKKIYSYEYGEENTKYIDYVSTNFVFNSGAEFVTPEGDSYFKISDNSKLMFDIDGKKLQVIEIHGQLKESGKIDISSLEGYLFER